MEKRAPVRIARKQAISMEELIPLYIKSMKLASGLNTQRIFAAWNEASGAAPYTLKRFFRDGEIFDYTSGAFAYIYGDGEAK